MTEPYYADESVTVYRDDCREVLAEMPPDSVDAIVTDPPYNLAFMGREWDSHDSPQAFQAWCGQWAAEAYRVLKPGGHLLAFGGTRTWHRMVCAVEDAGFEIRDTISWLYGQGYAKSLNVSKAIDKARDDRADALRVAAFLAQARDAAGLTNQQIDAAFDFSGMAGHWTARPDMKIVQVPSVEQWQRLRELIGFGDAMDAEVCRLNERKGSPGEAWQTADVDRIEHRFNEPSGIVNVGQGDRTPVERLVKLPNSDGAARWAGWGTALKPGFEPVAVARKPLAGTVSANVLTHGTGALNIDACRVGDAERTNHAGGSSSLQRVSRVAYGYRSTVTTSVGVESTVTGRWPTNVVLSHAATLDGQDLCADGCVPGCPVAELDAQSGVLVSGANPTRRSSDKFRSAYGEFKGQEQCEPARGQDVGGASRFFPVFRYEAKASDAERPVVDGVEHETVKPLDFMRWLVRLVTPPGGLVVDLFAGSGTTVEAAIFEGFPVVGIERAEKYMPLILARVERARRRLQPGIARLIGAKVPVELPGQGSLFDAEATP